MKRARDVKEQLVGLMQRVEMEIVSGITETVNIRKVVTLTIIYSNNLSENFDYLLLFAGHHCWIFLSYC